jgi:hypothetical protein
MDTASFYSVNNGYYDSTKKSLMSFEEIQGNQEQKGDIQKSMQQSFVDQQRKKQQS